MVADECISTWASLPPEILVRIYRLLPLKNLGRCSQASSYKLIIFSIVCRFVPIGIECFIWMIHGENLFSMTTCWSNGDSHNMRAGSMPLTICVSGINRKEKLTVYRHCIPMIIDKWREIVVQPVANLFNLYEFMQKITNFSEFHER